MITLTGTSGQYRFQKQKDRLGAGRKFNHVYRGTDEQGNPVIIKQLLPHLSNDRVSINRFRNEFDLRVEHPNIITARDYWIHNGDHYLVRNYVEGKDLTHTLHRQNIGQSIHICTEVLKALHHLHTNQVLHLDVQPKNIIIGTDRRVYLTDIGLARSMNTEAQRQPFNIYYSAPEQILNRQHLVNPTTDLFAVGMILLELVNKSSFQSHPNPEVLMNLVLASPLANHASISEPLFNAIVKAASKPRFNLPPSHYAIHELDELIRAAQCLRYQQAGEFINALQQLGPADLATRKWWKFW